MKRTSLPVITSCDDCGVCCHGQEALPVSWYLGATFRLGDPATLPPEVRAALEQMLARFMEGGFPVGTPCVWYDAGTKRCRHYEYRPDICKTEVAPGDDACRRIRKRHGMDGAARFALRNGKVVRA